MYARVGRGGRDHGGSSIATVGAVEVSPEAVCHHVVLGVCGSELLLMCFSGGEKEGRERRECERVYSDQEQEGGREWKSDKGRR